MKTIKTVFVFFLFGIQFFINNAEDVVLTNITEISNDSPRLVQDSYLTAYSNSRKGETNPDRTSVVYVTAANQNTNKTVQTVSVKAPVVNQNANKNVYSTANKVSHPQTAIKTNNVRREDNNYVTGPYAEPTSFSAFSSTDSQNGYNSYHNPSYSDYNSYPENNYFPQGNTYKYGAPNYNVKPSYGPPHHYAPSNYGNGPTSPTYGPTSPTYGPPPKPVYGVPYGIPSFFDKFKLKLDLLTLAKVILKLIIFKKIVKFIAIICLLLFIPKLIHVKKGKDEDDDEYDERKLQFNVEGRTDQSLNTLYAFVQHAIDTYSRQQMGCEDVGCRMKNVLDTVDEEYDFTGVADMFGNNES